MTAGRLMWFQRLTSPLDDVLNQKAVGIALYPEQDNFNLSIDHLFPVIWLAEYDRYQYSSAFPNRLIILASLPTTSRTLCLSGVRHCVESGTHTRAT